MDFGCGKWFNFEARAPVAQLDRASDFGSEGWGFDSLRARQKTAAFPRLLRLPTPSRIRAKSATRHASTAGMRPAEARPSARQRRYLAVMRNNGAVLLDLVNDILDLANRCSGATRAGT